jgi:hypothetical protein
MHTYSNGTNLHVLSHEKLTILQKWFLTHQKCAWFIGFLLGPLRRQKSLAGIDYKKNMEKAAKTTES